MGLKARPRPIENNEPQTTEESPTLKSHKSNKKATEENGVPLKACVV